MDNSYPSNSHNRRERQLELNVGENQKEKVVKVVTGEVITRKKPIGRKFKDIFVSGDFRSAARYVTAEILFPYLRKMLVDGTVGGMERIVYGDTRRSTVNRDYDNRARVIYHTPVGRNRDVSHIRDYREREYEYRSAAIPDQPPYYSRKRRLNIDDIVLSSRLEAEAVLDQLIDSIDKYQVVSLADLYDLLGLAGSPVDYSWGWKSLGNVVIRQVSDGFLLELPPAEAIKEM